MFLTNTVTSAVTRRSKNKNTLKGDHNDHEATVASLKQVRVKVVRTAKARNVNHLVLLDEHNEVGGRYNGGKLSTPVIVDAQGNVRRRFIDARNIAMLEAMLAEAAQPPTQPRIAAPASSTYPI